MKCVLKCWLSVTCVVLGGCYCQIVNNHGGGNDGDANGSHGNMESNNNEDARLEGDSLCVALSLSTTHW